MTDAAAPLPPAPELSIVVPVFKEGEAVAPVLRALDNAVSTPHEILVVYDFDEDPTVPVIDAPARGHPGDPRPATTTWDAACSTR